MIFYSPLCVHLLYPTEKHEQHIMAANLSLEKRYCSEVNFTLQLHGIFINYQEFGLYFDFFYLHTEYSAFLYFCLIFKSQHHKYFISSEVKSYHFSISTILERV